MVRFFMNKSICPLSSPSIGPKKVWVGPKCFGLVQNNLGCTRANYFGFGPNVFWTG